MKKFPDIFEPLFVWIEELLSADAILEMLQLKTEEVDNQCLLIWDFLQEYAPQCGEESK